ncbi:hypothetical protein MLD38_020455 [Melastoma candidum]|uniref:Uncharacterized protein n=1 Tax=Melastoma candidum TaxID=119954 RepID=A0ACB9QCY9_9MYRT|nr:hypothetical protein MLD38_020455 [Melastoma candidum]
MSSRLVKKVLKEQELQKQSLPLTEEEDAVDLGESESPPGSRNPFDILDDDDEDGGAADEGNHERSMAVAAMDDAGEHDRGLGGSSSGMRSTHRDNSKKKKKKKKNKRPSTVDDPDDPSEIDGILESLSLNGGKGSAVAGDQNKGFMQRGCAALQINRKYLKAETELRKIFGSKVVKSFEASNQAGTSRHTHGGGRRGNHNPRKSILVTPSEHWPRWDGSLSMEFLESKDGFSYFRYMQSPSYLQAQDAFEALKASHDLNGIASILLDHPYHLDSLLTIAEYFKVVGEHQMSADAVAKCLYALECAWHPMFNSSLGNTRLKYSHQTNQPFFKALFIQMNSMERRGCHRSALEVCKLLLSLDSEDPLGALFCIDYFALRAGEYSWLEEFSQDYEQDNSLWLFPNFSFSLAICRFYLEQEELKNNNSSHGKSLSVDLLKQALVLYPSVLKKLVAKVPLKDQFWGKIIKHTFFRSENLGLPSLDHLINIYVERNYLIWRSPDLQNLLHDAVKATMEALETSEPELEDWACLRKETFSATKNEYSYLLVSDFSDSVPSISPENLEHFVVGPGIGQPQPLEGHPNNRRVEDVVDIGDRSTLAALFESILPWVNYGRGDDDLDRLNDNNDHE